VSIALVDAIELLLLLLAANGAPVLLARLLGDRGNFPVDAGLLLPDGRPLFGRGKTWRGLVAGIAACAVLSSVLGLGALFGAVFGACSLAGDLCSSFLKRRLGIASSGRATGLDQIPEAALPLVYARTVFPLDALTISVLTLLFLLGSLVMSRWMYRLGIRKQPY
jgi:CDP-2,3-bis-(O-geranylgeranyl)-sn-glycerol synthase